MASPPQVLGARVIGAFDSAVGLDAVLDDLPVGVLLLSPDRRVLFLNQTAEAVRVFGRDEVLGVPCRHVLRANFCPQSCPVLRLGQGTGAITTEGDIINRERSRFSVRVNSSPVYTPDGRLAGFLETLEDLRRQDGASQGMYPDISFGRILGRSPKMEHVFRILPALAQTDSSVLITGETGTGKDLIAEAIHEASPRNRGPFIKVNCGALPETLLESELFGHVKGAFTGAINDKPGRIRLAQKGSLFLTEIGDLPLPLQVKLLTFLDDKVVYPLGGARSFQADVRVVAATHRDLDRMVREGQFREDLLFRLNVVRVNLPPLRERGDDLFLLLDHFLKVFVGRFKKDIKGFSEGTLKVLAGHSYPGNVRELRNIVEYATNICQEEQIRTAHLPGYLVESPSASKVVVLGTSTSKEGPEPAVGNLMQNLPDSDWSTVERQMIVDALIKAKGRRTQAAEILGWGRSTLWRKMKHYGL